MGSRSTRSEEVQIFLLPWNKAGHLRPMMGMAELFSSRGAKAAILTPASHPLHHSIPSLLLKSSEITQDSLRDLLLEHRPLPSCIIFDALFPWVVDVAEEFSFPAFAFHGSSSFTSCAHSVLSLHPPPPSEKSFFVPGLPHRVEFLRTQMARLDTPLIAALQKNFELSKARCHGLIMNSFEDLEKDYLEKIRSVLGKDVWAVGPLPMISEMAQGEANGVLKWLDEREPRSVVYVCFGSMGGVADEQNCEIAAALEMLGHPFVWVTSKPAEGQVFSKNEKKGIVLSGWAPQTDILNHVAVGAFVTHCGWNSCIEAIAVGVPMVTWPLMAEQFFNEKLVTQVVGVGVEVGSKIWAIKPEERNLIGRQEIYRAIKRVIGEGEESAMLYKRVRELAASAQKAIAEGGSSWNDVGCLIEQLRQGKWNFEK